MGPDAVYRLALNAGLGPEAAVIATAIAWAESGLDPDAVGDSTLQDEVWGTSVGLWQVRSLRADLGTGRARDALRLHDPAFNAAAMVSISGGTDWTPWTVYRTGAYAEHLDAVRAALVTPVEIVRAVIADVGTQGISVQEITGWEGRGRPYAFNPRGLVCHHTATQGYAYDYPSLAIVRDGRSDLPGPLAQFGLGRHTGTVYVISGGYCIEADAGVLTRRGIVPIQDVVVGDQVWTHRSRWRPVTAVVQRQADSVRLVGMGHPGIVCSADHRWFAKPAHPKRANRLQSESWDASPPSVIPARDMHGSLWLSPATFSEDEVAPGIDGWTVTPELLRVVGAWVADGAMGTDFQPKITPRSAKAAVVEGWLDAAGLRWHRRSDDEGVARIGIGSAALGRWLLAHFGRKSVNRTLPGWLLCGPDKLAEAFLEGYLHGDGHNRPAGRGRSALIDVNTSSRCLAFGLRMLAQKVGLYAYVTSVREVGEIVIKGRLTASTAPNWTVIIRSERPENPHAWLHQGWWASRVRAVEPVGERALYDITVGEDESFVVDGILTHNCNHAGGGGWAGLTGNGSVWGIEAENDGIGEAWGPEILRSYIALAAALARHTGFGAEMVARHAEWSDGGKIDTATNPLNSGAWIRARVDEALHTTPTDPEGDPYMLTFRYIAEGVDWVFDGPSHLFFQCDDTAQITEVLDPLGVKALGQVSASVHRRYSELARAANFTG